MREDPHVQAVREAAGQYSDLVSQRYEVIVSGVTLTIILQIVVIIFINIVLLLAWGHHGGLPAACGSDESGGQV